MSKPSDLLQGTLDLLLLKISGPEPLHAWGINLRLKSISRDVLQVSDGALYPALRRLEQKGSITAEWKRTENNRQARFYSLTHLGGRQLDSEAANWQRLSAAISHVVQLSELERKTPMRMGHWWFTAPPRLKSYGLAGANPHCRVRGSDSFASAGADGARRVKRQRDCEETT